MGKIIDKNILACPECRSKNISFTDDKITCTKCKAQYSCNNKKYFFSEAEEEEISNTLDKIKYRLKKFSRIYNFLMWLVSPVYSRNHQKMFLKNYIEGKNVTALNLGSGSSNISSNVSNVDLFPYDNVDLTGDIAKLPLKSESIDYVVNMAVLEHVPYPEKVVQEIHRILKIDGLVCCYMPFMVGYHASPYDFSRLTYEGMKIIFKNFEIMELEIGGGPTSGFLWVLQEWLAIILSFGSKKLHLIIYLMVMVLTFPIKFLDILLIHHPLAKNIASGFIIIARKK